MIWDSQWGFEFPLNSFFIMNSFTITERNKNQQIYQWICDIQIKWKFYLNFLRIIISELFEHWTMLIVFLVLVFIFSIWLTIKPNYLRKFSSRIFGRTWSNLLSPVRLSICLSVHQSVTHFCQDLPSVFS